MMQWKIYYDDGSVCCSDDGLPQSVPQFGVQAIVQKDNTPQPANVGRIILARWDYYWWRQDKSEWWGGKLDGVLDHLLNRLPIEAVCMGRSMNTGEFRDLMQRVEADPDFPKKSGKHPLEIQ